MHGRLVTLVILKVATDFKRAHFPAEDGDLLALIEEDGLLARQFPPEDICLAALVHDHLDVVLDVENAEFVPRLEVELAHALRHLDVWRLDRSVTIHFCK